MTVRIGIIGTGGIAIEHLTNLLRLPDAEVVALCDLTTAQIDLARATVARKLSVDTATGAAQPLEAATYTDYHAMLRDERLDGVYLCIPPFAHGEPEAAVIAAGVPLLVEKPVGLDLHTAAQTLARIRERGLLTAVGYQLRYTAAADRARTLLANTTIGMALALRFGATPNTPWYHRQNQSGGQLTEMATHQIDLLRYLVGEVRTVTAAATTRINNQHRPDYDIFDANAMTLTFDNGVIGSFANNFLAWPGAVPQLRGLHLFCDGLILSLDNSDLRAVTPDGTEEVTAQGDAMEALDATFIRAIAEGHPELVRADYADATRTLAVTLAADRAARTGQPVEITRLLAEVGL